MKTVEGPADLAVGDQVEVREYSQTGNGKRRRGVVTKVGELAAQVAFVSGGVAGVNYGKKIKERVFRRVETRIFRPLRKLTAHDLWLEKEPKDLIVVWVGGMDGQHVRTVIVDAKSLRDDEEKTVAALRAYGEWLRCEPKEGT